MLLKLGTRFFRQQGKIAATSLRSPLSMRRVLPGTALNSISLGAWYPCEPAEHTSEWCRAVGMHRRMCNISSGGKDINNTDGVSILGKRVLSFNDRLYLN